MADSAERSKVDWYSGPKRSKSSKTNINVSHQPYFMENVEKEQKFHVVFLGESGFPFGMAAIRKMILISKALISAGAKVTVINRKGKFDLEEKITLEPHGVYQGINYIYTPGTIYKPRGFVSRNLQKIKGKLEEFRYLNRLRKNDDLDVGIISSLSFVHIFLYRLYAIVLRFPVVLNYVEWGPVMQHRKGFLTKVNDLMVDPMLVRWMDGALPISEILMNRFKQIAPTKPLLKIPVLCDFEAFELPKKNLQEPYFLYCGALSYREVVDFVIQAFGTLPLDYKANLFLVVSGSGEDQYKQFCEDIKRLENASLIKTFTNLPYSELVDLYLNAKALLIPLRPTLQDAARFPHKIGEYVAAGNPVITTNYGEIPYYFKNEETALIADAYEVSSFAEKMKFVLSYPKRAEEIGLNGKELGLREFDYLSYGPKLDSFLKNLL